MAKSPQSRTALGSSWLSCSSWGAVSSVDSCWPLQSVIICHFRGVMLSTNQDSSRYGRVSLQKHQWKQTAGLKLTVLWELDLCTVLVGHLPCAQRGSPCHLILEHQLWEACTSQWVGQQEKYLGPERLHSMSRESAWEVTDTRNTIYLLFPGMNSYTWEESVIAKPVCYS